MSDTPSLHPCDQCGGPSWESELDAASGIRICGFCVRGAIEGHDWTRADGVIHHIHCRRCLMIRRVDGRNKPCKGPSRIRALALGCEKVPHTGEGHLHGPDDDGPYDVDGVEYCGRCHRVSHSKALAAGGGG